MFAGMAQVLPRTLLGSDTPATHQSRRASRHGAEGWPARLPSPGVRLGASLGGSTHVIATTRATVVSCIGHSPVFGSCRARARRRESGRSGAAAPNRRAARAGPAGDLGDVQPVGKHVLLGAVRRAGLSQLGRRHAFGQEQSLERRHVVGQRGGFGGIRRRAHGWSGSHRRRHVIH
jgi:hypothetical protein